MSESFVAFSNAAGFSPVAMAAKWALPQLILALSRSRMSSLNKPCFVSTTKYRAASSG
jgi:hypothetical protein